MTVDITKPGISFMLVRHDAWCPGAHGDGNNCICNAQPGFVDEETMAEVMTTDFKNRAQRRAAAKAARKGGKP